MQRICPRAHYMHICIYHSIVTTWRLKHMCNTHKAPLFTAVLLQYKSQVGREMAPVLHNCPPAHSESWPPYCGPEKAPSCPNGMQLEHHCFGVNDV